MTGPRRPNLWQATLVVVCLLLLVVLASATETTRSALQTQNTTSITSNASGQISGAVLRSLLMNIIDSSGVLPSDNSWTGQNIFNGATTFNGGSIFTSTIIAPAATAAMGSIQIPPGVAPTTPTSGLFWTTSGGFFGYINGSTRTWMDLESSQTVVGIKTFSTIPIFSSLTGYVKANGAAILSAAPTIPSADFADGNTGTGTVAHAISPAFTGNPTAPTQSASDNSTKLATTAYVDSIFGAAHTWSALQTFNGGIDVNGGTLTSSAPTSITQTWNNAGTVFTGLNIAITDTASAAGSKPFNISVGGTPVFYVDKLGGTAAYTLTVSGFTLAPALYGGAGVGSTLAIYSTAGAGATDAIRFYTGSQVKRWEIPNAGHLLAGADNTYDIGASGATRPRNGFFAGLVQTGTTTVGSLPTCNAAAKGSRHFVTDANATTFLSTVAGGGANNVPVSCDGTNWVIGANDNIPQRMAA